MSVHTNPNLTPALSADTLAMLACLRETVAKTLERKRRLGEYYITEINNRLVAIGDDAPEHLKYQGDLP